MVKNREVPHFEKGLDNVTLDDIITYHLDGSEGAEWKVVKIDGKGNLHAELIDRKNASDFYHKIGDVNIIPPEAWNKWEKLS